MNIYSFEWKKEEEKEEETEEIELQNKIKFKLNATTTKKINQHAFQRPRSILYFIA